MALKGEKIYHCTDEWGAISVFQDAGMRYLSFGNDVEQSCIDINTPERLCHNYTQTMMLGFLLVKHPKECAILGLGAGSLAHAVLTHLPQCQINAVEQRERVVDLAQQWFLLPHSKRLDLHIMDASKYLAGSPTPADVMLTDLYFSDGMNELQAKQDFLASCRSALKPGGVLVCNYWLGNSLTSYALNQSLQDVFNQQVVTISIPDGNCISFAFDGGIPKLNQKRFIKAAEILGATMDIPLQRHARVLMHENRLQFQSV